MRIEKLQWWLNLEKQSLLLCKKSKQFVNCYGFFICQIWCRSPYPNFDANTEENFTEKFKKNESGNGMRLTQKFLKPFKVYISKPRKN